MALPNSGPITMAMIAAEIGISASGLSLNDGNVRQLAGKPSGAISFADLLGKAWAYLNSISCNYSDYSDYVMYRLLSVDSNTSWSADGFFRAQRNVRLARSGNTWQMYPTRSNDSNCWGDVTIRVTGAGKSIDWNFPRLYVADWQSSSCFTGDSLVVMADYSLRRIDEVKVGDMVRTATGVGKVWKVHKPKLGDRPLVSFNGRCKTSAEHSLWTRNPATGEEYWSTRDMKQWQFEGDNGLGPTSEKPLFDLTSKEGEEWDFATVDGWHRTTWMRHDAPADTQLYNLRLDDGGSYFVDGYLVSSRFSVDNDVDWTKFNWKGLKHESIRDRFVRIGRRARRLFWKPSPESRGAVRTIRVDG